MKTIIEKILNNYPKIYRLLQKTWHLCKLPKYRIVRLSRNELPINRFQEIEDEPSCNDVISDLVAYTGFTRKQLQPYILRHPKKHFESEFTWNSPKTNIELTWFYRFNAAYLFANSVHPYLTKLDVIKGGEILDYGAGAGCHTIHLGRKGYNIDFLEINCIQADFIKFRAERHGIKSISEIRPYYKGKFDPIGCITGYYDVIIAMDVLEHIPNYHYVVNHFIEHLNPGGIIIESSPFNENAKDIDIHIRASIPLEKAMNGMTRVQEGVWVKPKESNFNISQQ